ncbi:hypothetical protein [Pseudarthrobacter sp. S9]|uniref:hypothetical protein n=1 Tax=Pseudarthrobacter sp. S9 TaxID=3418421 RepID=UPI003D0448C5
MATSLVKRVVVMVQENQTTDNYFRGLAPYRANVATDWPLQPTPPASDQSHDRHAYYNWLTGRHKATQTQFDTTTMLPFYTYLALTGALLETTAVHSPLPAPATGVSSPVARRVLRGGGSLPPPNDVPLKRGTP